MNLQELEVVELTHDDAQQMSGGTFGHDVGVALRFAYIQTTQGYAAAVADYAYNSVMCGC